MICNAIKQSASSSVSWIQFINWTNGKNYSILQLYLKQTKAVWAHCIAEQNSVPHLRSICSGGNNYWFKHRHDHCVLGVSTIFYSSIMKIIYHGFHKNIEEHNHFQHW